MNAATLPRGGKPGLVVGLVGVLATGAFVVWQLMAQGHAAYNTTSAGLMWGLPIATYDFLLMSSCGLTLLASLWTVFGRAEFEPVARRALWLALATLVGGVAALFLELGHPLRALYAIPLSFQIKAPLFWKVLTVGVYGAALVLLATRWIAAGAAQPPARGLALVAALAALATTFLGALMYATMSMRPFWFAGELPALFLIEALLGGAALLALLAPQAGGAALARMAAWLAALYLLFVGGRAVVGLAGNLDGLQVWQTVVGGAPFWIGLAAVVVGLWLAAGAARGGAGLSRLAGALLVLGLFIGKYEFVVAGQLVPLFKGSWVRGLIVYTPSAAEWCLLALAVFLSYAIYAFGAGRFALDRRAG